MPGDAVLLGSSRFPAFDHHALVIVRRAHALPTWGHPNRSGPTNLGGRALEAIRNPGSPWPRIPVHGVFGWGGKGASLSVYIASRVCVHCDHCERALLCSICTLSAHSVCTLSARYLRVVCMRCLRCLRCLHVVYTLSARDLHVIYRSLSLTKQAL